MNRRSFPTILFILCAFSPLAYAAVTSPQEQQQVLADLAKVQAQLKLYPSEDYVEVIHHQFFSDKLPPLLHQKLDLLAKLTPVTPAQKLYVARSHLLDSAILSLYEPQLLEQLKISATSQNLDESHAAQLALAMNDYWTHPTADAQAKILDEVEAAALKNPLDNLYTSALLDLHNLGPADQTISARIDAFIINNLHSTLAIQYRTLPNKLDHPLKIVGTTSEGRAFSSDKWKGKVLLVDFWATWCPPCKEEMPNVVKLYDQYHAQGLEVVGVSCDPDHSSLVNFLKDHPEIRWPNLYGPSPRTGTHVLAELYNIDSIPRMYLIDKNGILRSMNAWQDKEKLVPLLLAESPSTQPAPKP